MKIKFLFTLLLGVWMLSCIPVQALLKTDTDDPEHPHPYHFKKDGEPFYLLTKSAFRLMVSDVDYAGFINEAHEQGFNSLRIWMMWPFDFDQCGGLLEVQPWKYEPGDPDHPDWYQSWDSNYWNRLPNFVPQNLFG